MKNRSWARDLLVALVYVGLMAVVVVSAVNIYEAVR